MVGLRSKGNVLTWTARTNMTTAAIASKSFKQLYKTKVSVTFLQILFSFTPITIVVCFHHHATTTTLDFCVEKKACDDRVASLVS